ncbi:artemin [Xyrichtys novacula]|uniref:Artemin n=1 Tax=Xyrichtys novacula TaxID=13765 RepID=A0AAV1GEI6_XYRNO|nr:artemin [Xyrichtys novacula]
MPRRCVWIAENMSRTRRGIRSGSLVSPGAHLELNAHRTAGGTRWRVRGKDRHENASVMSAKAKVLLWVLLSLLPLVEGVHVKVGAAAAAAGSDSSRTVGLLGGKEEPELPPTLPGVVEDEEQDDNSDPYSTWHALYDPFVIDEVDDHPTNRWAGRSPRSSDLTEPQPKGSPKKKKKRKKKEKEEEEETGRGDRKGKGKNRQPKQSSRDCRVEKREMRVRDLGLGFDSDEIVLFKFCVGSCQSSRTNYDLALKALLENGSLPRRTARKVSNHPCCRPDRYEPVSFMDAQTTWRTIQSLSAASCMCMG